MRALRRTISTNPVPRGASSEVARVGIYVSPLVKPFLVFEASVLGMLAKAREHVHDGLAPGVRNEVVRWLLLTGHELHLWTRLVRQDAQ